jgi:succinylglutamic semialdehyde dehydrogenase
MKREDLPVYSSWIDGKITLPKDPTGEWTIASPARSDFPLARFLYAYGQIDEAALAAQQAHSIWKQKSFEERQAILKKALAGILAQKEKLIEVAQLELGRSATDLLLEWQQIEKWIAEFEKFKPENRGSRGVTAIIGSYVWPFFYSIQFSFLNLLAGNTVVIKPSEKSTLTVLEWAKVFVASEDTRNLIQVVVGEKELGRRLACHELVSNVIFTGSFEVGMRVRQDTLSQPTKEVLLYLGAKNPAILCEDYAPAALDTLIQDCFLASGQHCRSASVIFVHDSKYQAFIELFHQKAKQFKIGAPMSQAFTGPLIDEAMLDRYLKFIGISEREGAEIVMRGKSLAQPEKGYFATPTIAAFAEMTPERVKKSVSLQTEVLSPHVSVIRFESYDQLIAMHAQLNYGLCGSIWGANTVRNHKIAEQLRLGNVVLNQSLLEWNPAASFQGMKKSGNHAYHGFQLYEQLSSLKSVQE